MPHIQRVRGVKYDLSRFSTDELLVAVAHEQRRSQEQQRFLAALLMERELRLARDQPGVRADGLVRQAVPPRPADAA